MRRRSIKKQLWLNPTEDKLLKEKANKTALTESEFLRSCIRGYTIKEQPTEEIKLFQKQLSGIANNINQIAHKSNTYGYVSDIDLNYIRNTLSDFIMKFEKKIYSRER